jgi:hypothetical protein
MQIHRLMGGIYQIRRGDGSGAVTYVPSFIEIGSDIQKLIKGDTHTDINLKLKLN